LWQLPGDEILARTIAGYRTAVGTR
jgi:hypothetical protein